MPTLLASPLATPFTRCSSDERTEHVGQYCLGETIGTGSFGKVVIAYAEDGKEYAIKIMERKGMPAELIRRLKQEVAILKEVKHPCIVDLKEVLSTDVRIYLVFQLMTGGEVWKPGEPQSEATARVHLQRLCDGLAWCHNKGISHRDLKPENLLLNDAGELSIADFGLSALCSQANGMLYTTCGSPNFVAPEVLREAGYDGMQADVWSVGVIMFALLSGHLPFDDLRLHQLTRKILHGEFAFPANISGEARDLLTRVLVVDPAERATMADVRQHAWMLHDYKPIEPLGMDHHAVQRNESIESITMTEVAVTTPHNDAEPQQITQLNAFDLVTLSSALNLNNLFVYKQPTDAADAVRALPTPTLAPPTPMRYTSRAEPDELLSRLREACPHLSGGFRAYLASVKAPIIKLVSSQAKSVVVHAEVFKLTPGLNLLEVRHKLGSQAQFTELCNELLGVVADLLLFRPGTTPPAAMRQIPSPSTVGSYAASTVDSSADPHSLKDTTLPCVG